MYILSWFQLDHERHASSDESLVVSSPVEDRDADSSTMISSQDRTAVKLTPHNSKGQLPNTKSDDDTFTAHVIVEQALHLPTVPGNDGERYYSLNPSLLSSILPSFHPSIHLFYILCNDIMTLEQY